MQNSRTRNVNLEIFSAQVKQPGDAISCNLGAFGSQKFSRYALRQLMVALRLDSVGACFGPHINSVLDTPLISGHMTFLKHHFLDSGSQPF